MILRPLVDIIVMDLSEEDNEQDFVYIKMNPRGDGDRN